MDTKKDTKMDAKKDKNYLDEEYSFENIQTFFNKLDEAKNSKYLKLWVWSRFKRDKDRSEEENEILKEYKKDSFFYSPYVVDKIYDNFFIITCCEDMEKKIYTPYIDNKSTNWYFDSFDKAILAGLSIRYLGDTKSVEWLAKLLEMDKSD